MAGRGETTRRRMVETMTDLLRRQGLNGTGVLQVLDESGTPRGSLYHHFPGGKEELALEAVALARGTMLRWIGSAASVEQFLDRYAARLERHGVGDRCPVAAVVLEGAPASERLRAAGAEALDAWAGALARRLEAEGHAPADADRLATTVLCLLEGALVLARARGSAAPLREVGARLAPLLRTSGA
jgi:TetR/AcrR family transcriptional repressor of lmrAB and yxaGH operons